MLYNHIKTVDFRLMKEKIDTHNKGVLKKVKSFFDKTSFMCISVNRVRVKYSAGALRQPQDFRPFGNLRTFSFIAAGDLYEA